MDVSRTFDALKPDISTNILSICNFTIKLLDCFVLQTLLKNKTIEILLVKVLIDNIFVEKLGF